MTDWIQVLLGQPLEEAREDSLETLNQAAEDIWVRKRARQNGGEEELPAAEETAAERLSQPQDSLPPEALEERRGERFGLKRAGAENAGTGRDGAAAEREEAPKQEDSGEDRQEEGQAQAAAGLGAERLENWLRDTSFPAVETGRRGEEKQPLSAGVQAAQGALGEALAWQQSGAEGLEAASAGRQAEWAAAETLRRSSGGSGYLAAALSAPEYRTPSAGRLLAAMERNDRAAAYQTTARITEQVENSAWTGSDPARLDRFFERDARRYDNGFTMF